MDLITSAEWRGNAHPSRAAHRRHAAPGVEVHHTVTGRASSRDALIAIARAIYNDHVRRRDWADVFYGYLIGDTHVLEVRGINHLSGAVPHVVVGFVGDYEDDDEPTGDQLDALDQIRGWVRAAGGGNELAWHNQRDQTDCPGRHLVAALTSPRPQPKPTPTTQEVDMLMARNRKGSVLLVMGGVSVLIVGPEDLARHQAAGIPLVPCTDDQFRRYESIRVA